MRRQDPNGEIVAEQGTLESGTQKNAAQLNREQLLRGPQQPRPLLVPEHEGPEREDLPQPPGTIDTPSWPPTGKKNSRKRDFVPESAPQTLGLQFDGATGPTETGAFPPDTMGAVGPTQFVVFLNGRIRTFNKSTGTADGVLNVDSDVFFASVVTPPGSGEISFTSDPNVRFDRLTNRWFLTIIDVTLNSTTGATTRPNRILIAYSDAASNGIITASTAFTILQFQQDFNQTNTDTGGFADYPSLGIDANALYIGADMFSAAGSFTQTTGFVIPKAALLTGSVGTVWAFRGLAVGTGAGPFAPRGVDNYDPNNTGPTALGYFIGADNAAFSTLSLRRVTNPGSTDTNNPPTISANISITVPTTAFPVLVPHLGNTGGNAGRLDSLDDRLYAAHLRNGRLWTAHNIGVSNAGTASGTRTRCAARWYELQNLNTTPTLVESGTLFDNTSPNNTSQRNYWIPSIMVSGQGHAVLGCSIAGTNERINAFATGRLAGDTLGTLRDGPGGSTLPGYTASSTAYNPPSDPGGSSGRRWGDYSFTSLDPKDDMTIWTIQMYCNGTNTYGVRALQLKAPLPATPASASPSSATAGQSSVDVTITGTSTNGTGFYDPGTDPVGGSPFNHISASVTGGVTVNSVTYADPTHVTLHLSTVGATTGAQNVTITNPDGQSVTGTGIFTVNGAPCTITCPSNIVTNGNLSQCAAIVNYSAPTTSGSCGTVTCSPPSGSSFPQGVNTVNCSEPGGGSCSFTVTVNATATPTITPGGPTTFCAGGSVTLTSSSATGNQWFLNGNPIGGATNQTFSAAASGSYTVTATNGSCTSAQSASVTVTVASAVPTPTITAGGPTTFCTGGSVTLTSSSATGYQWFLNGNPIGGATNQTLVVTASGSYSVVVTSGSCTSSPSAATVVTVNPVPATPTITPGGPTTFCAGGSVTLTSSSATGNQWFLNGNPIGGATNQTFAATASGSYTVVVTTGGCSSAPSAATTVTVNPIPSTPTITAGGPTTFCSGGSVTLTSSSATGNQWFLNGNPIGGATNQTFVATASGSYTVVVTTNGCSSAPSATTTVTVNPVPSTPTITPGGPTTFCSGGNVTLTSSSATGNQWFLNGNPIGGATNQTFSANASGSYTVVVTTNGCSSSPSAPTVVTVNPVPATPTITAGGPTTFCTGGSVTLTSSSATGNQWFLNGNPIGGATNQTLVVTASGSYTVVVTASGCSSSPSAATTVTVNPVPATPTITPGGPTTFCSGGSVTLTSSSATGNQWFLNGNPIGGATNQTFSATASGNYTVVVTTGGCSSSPSAATTVTVNPVPATPTITAGGSTTFCSGGSVTLTSSSATGNQWFLNGNPIGGATNQTFSATASGSYTVKVTSGGCTSLASAATVVTVNPAPATPTITAGGPTSFCAGGSVVLTSSSATGNQWFLNGNPIGGATHQNFTATASGSYTVVVTASGCSSSPSAPTVVTANPIPPKPTITAGGPTSFCPGGSVTLTSSSATGNQWLLNGSPIGGATGQNYVATVAGSYTVVVTLGGCSSPASKATVVATVDTTPPSITCPTNITRVTAKTGDATVVVNYTVPTATDNCGTPSVVCTPPSGSAFPAGSTTVICTATDGANNQASCSFKVKVFDVCLQDDTTPGISIVFNTRTGDYIFCAGGVQYTGKGTVTGRGLTYTLKHNAADRRVSATIDGGALRGNASYQNMGAGGTTYILTDRDIRNDTCPCQTQ